MVRAERIETEGHDFAEDCWLLKLLIHWRVKSSVIWCTVPMCACSMWPFHLNCIFWGINVSHSYLRKKFSWVLLILVVLLCLFSFMFSHCAQWLHFDFKTWNIKISQILNFLRLFLFQVLDFLPVIHHFTISTFPHLC